MLFQVLTSFCRPRFLSLRVIKENMAKAVKRKNEGDTESKAKKPTAVGHWAQGLLNAMEDPNLQIYADNRVVVIKDKYPKAQYHFLLLPREKISNLKDINSSHLEVLQYMQKIGGEIIQRKEYQTKNFKMGYHSEPSMLHLHMHIISDDFCSDSLKNKKHYNSYTTEFFIESEKIIEYVKTAGRVVIPSSAKCKEFLQQPLVCCKCNQKIENIPKLKKHLNSHLIK